MKITRSLLTGLTVLLLSGCGTTIHTPEEETGPVTYQAPDGTIYRGGSEPVRTTDNRNTSIGIHYRYPTDWGSETQVESSDSDTLRTYVIGDSGVMITAWSESENPNLLPLTLDLTQSEEVLLDAVDDALSLEKVLLNEQPGVRVVHSILEENIYVPAITYFFPNVLHGENSHLQISLTLGNHSTPLQIRSDDWEAILRDESTIDKVSEFDNLIGSLEVIEVSN